MLHVKWNVLMFILFCVSIGSFAQTKNGNLQSASLRMDASIFNTGNSPERPEKIFSPVMDFSSERSSAFEFTLAADGISLITPVKQPAKKEHQKFFDLRNNMLIASSAAIIAMDGLSTQRFLSSPTNHEVNPIAHPFVRSRGGSAAYFGLSLAAEVAVMHFAHTHNHHRLERLLPVLVLASESFVVRNNYGLPTR
jgi:hypothetical protein